MSDGLLVEIEQQRADLARVTAERDAALLKIKVREFKDVAAVLGVRAAEHMFQISREESVALGVRPAHTLKKEWQMGLKDKCRACGHEIEYVDGLKPYWHHTTFSPRHIARPQMEHALPEQKKTSVSAAPEAWVKGRLETVEAADANGGGEKFARVTFKIPMSEYVRSKCWEHLFSDVAFAIKGEADESERAAEKAAEESTADREYRHRLAARIRADFPADFLTRHPALTQLLIEAATTLEAE